MTLLHWNPNLSIGIAEVDREHREFVDLVNRLHAGLGPARTGPAAAAFVRRVQADVAAHFAHEEQAMREHGYEALAEHRASHVHLLEELGDALRELDAGLPLNDERFARWLSAWLADHFQLHDARFHRYPAR
jgi:hemerythrin